MFNIFNLHATKTNILGIDYLFFPEFMISVFIIAVAVVGIFNIVILQFNKLYHPYFGKKFFLQVNGNNVESKRSAYLNLSKFYVYFCIFFMCLMLFIYSNSTNICV